ncbi:DUF4871 domain-containing protein [Paenibacillus hexagrammi]|uniref:DUF4871 domain-containing protein n=1 Tax=Paenibacillus hexagrammi TaxID=2908839 RepID=A0ABY3SP19_9BACL|nr:DUF4871 domain-containing protein [Paenibacillus sp. YPD9-1]UJF35285.1 DUF4871 domain-containing protein [Paenibacillus sp. YPD9-1]
MKKNDILIGSLFVVSLLFSLLIHINWNNNKVSNQANVHEQEWKTSPIFSVGERTMVGQPAKIGILDTAFIAGKQKGVHWFLWGDQKKLVKGTFKLTASTQGARPLTIVENYAIAYGSEGVDAQVPTLMSIPSPGLWKLVAYVDDEIYGSIVIRVSE